MTMVEIPPGEVEDPEGGSSLVRGEGGPGGELVLPEEVLASLAGQLAERARAGDPVTLTGPGGLLSGIIGQVLQAGLGRIGCAAVANQLANVSVLIVHNQRGSL